MRPQYIKPDQKQYEKELFIIKLILTEAFRFVKGQTVFTALVCIRFKKQVTDVVSDTPLTK